MSQAAAQDQQPQQHPNAWLWGQDNLADVTLHVRPCRDGLAASTSLQSSQPASQPQPSAASLSLHSLVLAGASPGYFRPKLLELRAQEVRQAANQAQEAMQAASQPPQDSVRVSLRVVAATESEEPWRSINGRLRTTTNPPMLLAALAGLHQQVTHTNRGSMSRQAVLAAEPAAPPPGTTPETAPPTPAYTPRASKTLHLTLHPGEPHTVPEAVLRHVYTGTLPDDPEQLIWMLWRADHLDLAATVTACITKLRTLADSKNMTMLHATQLHNLGLGLQNGVPALLTSAFRNTTGVPVCTVGGLLGHEMLLQQFTQLPLSLVKQWVGERPLVIDSGNTLAVLFTAWYDAQPTPPTEEQCQELSALLPLSSLTLCYHLQVVPHLKWWQPPAAPKLPTHTGLAYALTLLCPDVKEYKTSWEAAAKDPSNGKYNGCTWLWTVTPNKLHDIWNDNYSMVCVHASGYYWQPTLQMRQVPDQDGKVLDCKLSLSLPPPLVKHGLDKHIGRLAAHVKVEVKATFNAVPPATQPRVVTKPLVPNWETSEWVCRDAGNKVFCTVEEWDVSPGALTDIRFVFTPVH